MRRCLGNSCKAFDFSRGLFTWSCPNPDLKTNDPKVAAWQKESLGHD